LSDCNKISGLFWEYLDESLNVSQKELLDKHLIDCVKCRAEFETIKTLAESKKQTKRQISAIDPETFDNKIMNKIHIEKRLSLHRDRDTRYVVRMSVSMALAAAVVLFMLMSISDFRNLPGVYRTEKKASSADNGRALINIELLDGFEQKSEPGAHKRALGAKGKAAKAEDEKEVFSILSGPITNPSPESVHIGAVYLTEESVPTVSQQARASLNEIVIDTGVVESIPPPSSVLITVEKMPVLLNMPTPIYPVWAQKRKISGTVWVKARVNIKGDVENAIVLSSSNPGAGFENSSIEAALKSKYIPAESNGLPIPVWVVYPVKFIHKQ
jgi:TonB family protein